MNNTYLRKIISKRYTILSNGTIIGKKTKKEMKTQISNKGYKKLNLYVPEISTRKSGLKCFYLHRLVALFHLKTFNKNLQINHKDGNKVNNTIENLEMVTASENALHAWRTLDSTNRRLIMESRRQTNGRFGKKQD